MTRSGWTIGDYIEELICICEIVDVPGMRAKLEALQREIVEKFDEEVREAAGLLF